MSVFVGMWWKWNFWYCERIVVGIVLIFVVVKMKVKCGGGFLMIFSRVLNVWCER